MGPDSSVGFATHSGGTFRADGEVRLPGASIGGDLTSCKSQFMNGKGVALGADAMNVKGSVFLVQGFKAQGQVRLVGATIGGQFAFLGAQIANKGGIALSADGLNVRGGVFLREGSQTRGEVGFVGATIQGNLECDKVEFVNDGQHALSADGLNVQGWSAEEMPAGDDSYESVTCLACAQLHFVNRRTGRVLGADDEK